MERKIEAQNENQAEKPLSFLGKHLLWTTITLFALLIVFIIVFLWKYPFFCFNNTIDAERWGQFGDFIGGTFGTVLTFLSIILLYKAFEAQREANELTKLSYKQIVGKRPKLTYCPWR